jgi:ABC-type Mn2+/Zn2+ transport system permease subunit
VLGMALSIAFGIANTFSIGVAFYAVCAATIVVSRRRVRVSEDEITSAAMAVAPSIQPTLTDAAAGIPAGKQLESTAPAD